MGIIMKMNKKLSLLMILIGLVLQATGCMVRNQSAAQYTIVEGEEITDTYQYTVEDDFPGMKLKINLTLTKGEVTFELKDPNGEIKWTGKATSGQTLNEVKEFDKAVGEWVLTFYSIDNTGEGKLKLQFNRN